MDALFHICQKYLRRPFVRQTLLLMMGRGASKLLSFLAFVLIARALGPDLFGGFTFAFTLASLLIFIPSMGADPFYTREVSAGRAVAKDLLGIVLFLKILGSVIFLGLYFGGLFITTKNESAREAALWVGVAFVFISISQTWAAVLITSARIGMAGFLEASQACFFLLFIASFLFASPTAGMAAKGFLVAQVVGATTGFGVVWRITGLPSIGQKITTCLHMLLKTVPLALVWLVSDLYLRINTAMLFYLLGDVETGLYSASYRLVEGVYSAAIVVCTTALPRLSIKWSHGPAHWRKEWNHVLGMLAAVVSIPAIGFTFFPDFLVHFLYGPSFAGAAKSLRLLGPASLALCIVCGYGIALTSLGFERRQLVIGFVALVFNVLLNFWLIPLLGGPGAALATLISAVLYVSLAHIVLRIGFNQAINKAIWES